MVAGVLSNPHSIVASSTPSCTVLGVGSRLWAVCQNRRAGKYTWRLPQEKEGINPFVGKPIHGWDKLSATELPKPFDFATRENGFSPSFARQGWAANPTQVYKVDTIHLKVDMQIHSNEAFSRCETEASGRREW